MSLKNLIGFLDSRMLQFHKLERLPTARNHVIERDSILTGTLNGAIQAATRSRRKPSTKHKGRPLHGPARFHPPATAALLPDGPKNTSPASIATSPDPCSRMRRPFASIV